MTILDFMFLDRIRNARSAGLSFRGTAEQRKILLFPGSTMTSENADLAAWVGFVIGGIIGAIFVLSIFDWALIVLSALAGSALILPAIVYLFVKSGLNTFDIVSLMQPGTFTAGQR